MGNTLDKVKAALTGKQAQQGGQVPTTAGPMHAVKCPHCGKPNDCRALHEQQLMDLGSSFICDHCGRNQQIVRIAPVTIVTVRKAPPSSINGAAGQNTAQPAQTLSPAQARKLLGR